MENVGVEFDGKQIIKNFTYKFIPGEFRQTQSCMLSRQGNARLFFCKAVCANCLCALSVLNS